jgi:Ner family transcriptional regulator
MCTPKRLTRCPERVCNVSHSYITRHRYQMTKTAPKKTGPEDWHPADIVAALHKRGITLRALAKQHGLTSPTTLSKAMAHSYPASEKRLADAVGVPVQEMFAARYHPDGTPKGRGIRGAHVLHSSVSHC